MTRVLIHVIKTELFVALLGLVQDDNHWLHKSKQDMENYLCFSLKTCVF